METNEINSLFLEIENKNLKLFIDIINLENQEVSKKEEILIFLGNLLNITKETLDKDRIKKYISKINEIRIIEIEEKEKDYEIEFNY